MTALLESIFFMAMLIGGGLVLFIVFVICLGLYDLYKRKR